MKPEDFFRHAHRLIFKAIQRVLERKAALDLVTLKDDLTRAGELDECGGPAYISALLDGVPKSSNIEHYAAVIAELRRLRDCIYFGSKVISAAYDSTDTSEAVMQAADTWLMELRGEVLDGAFVTQTDALGQFVDALSVRMLHKDELIGRSTGLPTLDDFTSGMVPGEMTILAASTGGGKSALALGIARAIVKMSMPVLVFSLEMSRQDLQFRLASNESGVPLFKIRKGWLNDQEMDRVCVAMAKVSEFPLFIDETLDLTSREMRARARKLSKKYGSLGLVVIDYIQLVTGLKKKGDDRRSSEVAEVSRSAKLLARELNVPVLVLSQLSRGEKKKRRPELWDLKETSSLEQDADQVWFLYADDDKNEDLTIPITELIVAKARSGPTGSVDLVFERDCVRFYDPKAVYQEEAPAQPVQTDLPDGA